MPIRYVRHRGVAERRFRRYTVLGAQCRQHRPAVSGTDMAFAAPPNATTQPVLHYIFGIWLCVQGTVMPGMECRGEIGLFVFEPGLSWLKPVFSWLKMAYFWEPPESTIFQCI